MHGNEDAGTGTGVRVVIISPDALSVRLFCSEIVNQFKKIPSSRVTVICRADESRRELESLGLQVIDIDFYRHFSISKDLKYVVQLWVFLRRIRPDIVFNISTKPLIYGAIAGKLAKSKWIINYNVGLGKGFGHGTNLRQLIIKGTLKYLYRISYLLSDKDWFTNQHDFHSLTSSGLVSKKKAFVTRFYLNTDYYSRSAVPMSAVNTLKERLGLSEGTRVVCMVARLIWAKGVGEFVEAAEAFAHRDSRVTFVLLAPEERGSDDCVPLSFIEGACDRLPNFKWINFMDDPRALYDIAEISVLPSFYPEGGFPRALTEPMAMEKPIITTDNPSCSGTVEPDRNGYIVPIRDSIGLVDAIAKLLDDASLREQFSRYSREKALREFDEKKIVPEAFAQLGLEQFGWQHSPVS